MKGKPTKKMRIASNTALVIGKVLVGVKRYYRCQKPYFLAVVFVVTGLVYLSIYYWQSGHATHAPRSQTAEENIKFQMRMLVAQQKGGGCEMPKLDPFSSEAMGYIVNLPDKVECTGIDWVECYFSKCFVVDKILAQMKDVVCLYQDIIFVNDYYSYLGEVVRVYNDEKYVLNRSDQVKVSCSGLDKHGRGLLSNRWFGFKAGYRPLKMQMSPAADSFNVLLLLFDSVSTNSFLRRLPKSYAFLNQELNAVIMESYNIVGDATSSALFPILTGHTHYELPNAWNDGKNSRKVDLKPFIFLWLKERGYRTAYFEEMPSFGTFQYKFNGFARPPTDHYLRPFFLEEAKTVRKWWIGGKKKFCLGAVPQHNFLLNYTAEFFELDGKKFCVSFFATLSHNSLSAVSMADNDLVQFLKKFRDDGRLNDTALFLMADHGYRYGPFRDTYQGTIEERLPFVSVVLPDRLKTERPDAFNNLMANSKVLTTPFDVHTTLLDILGLKEHRNKYQVPGVDVERGQSFLDPIPKFRSCAEADVMPHWCACALWRNVTPTDPVYRRAANILADYINSISEENRTVCAERKLISIEWVYQLVPGDLTPQDIKYFMVKVTMSPGNSIFEGSMQYVMKDKYFMITERDISRVNAYGDEGHCVSHTQRKYCYCKDKLNSNTGNI